MLKNKYYFYFLFFFLVSACSTKEHLQRDLIIANQLDLEIQPSSNLVDTMLLTEITIDPSLNAIISQNTTNLGEANLSGVHLTSFSLELQSDTLDGTPVLDTINNLQAFENITVQLQQSNGETITIGSINGDNIQSSSVLQLPLSNAANQDLIKYFTSGNLSYTITGVNRLITDKPIRVQATAIYKLSLKI